MRSRNYGTSLTALIAVLALTISCANLNRTDHASEADEQGWLYDSITFEIAPITSADPSPRALEVFRTRLDENHLCRKKNVRFIVRRATAGPPFNMPWSSSLLSGYEQMRRSVRDETPFDRDLKVFVAYIDGPYFDFTRLRRLGGVQYSDTAFAIFKSGARDREASVLLHEFGHLIGLVKDEARQNHDEEHQHHCVVQSCAMYFTAPGPVADFDLYCKRQIAGMIAARDAEDED